VEEISIGEFARRSRLSLKALRLYDERGVLVPSRVDQASGYWQLAAESLDTWGQEQEHEHEGERLALTPEDLGLRTTYLAAGPSDPGIDLAVPFAVER